MLHSRIQNTAAPASGFKALFILAAVFFGGAFFWSRLIPFDDAPDEWAHYYFNVRPILERGELPVSGVDDREAFLAGRLNRFGSTSARYSYAAYPPHGYLPAAMTARIGRALGLPLEQSARFASVLLGTIFAALLFRALVLLTGEVGLALWVTGTAAFIPQVIFIASYVNTDIYSLAVSALLGFASVRLFVRPTAVSFACFGAAAGLIIGCKFNYYVYLPAIAVGFIVLASNGRTARAIALRAASWSAVGILALNGYFIIRNLRLYGDPLGVAFVRDQMLAHQGRLGAAQRLDFETISHLLSRGFFFDTFKTAFGEFGYLSLQLEPTTYSNLYWASALSAIVFVALFVRGASRGELSALYSLAAFSLSTFALYLYNTFTWDYQAQGRYLFPLITPSAIFLGWAMSRNGALRLPFAVFSGAIFLTLLESNLLLIRTYHPGALSGPGYDLRQAKLSLSAEMTGYEKGTDGEPVEISPEHPVIQRFRMERSGLTGVVIWVSKDSPRTTNLHRVSIADAATGEILREAYIFPFELVAGQPVSFVFKRLESAPGKDLVFQLSAEPAPGSANLRTNTFLSRVPDTAEAVTGGKSIGRSLALNIIYE